MDSKLPTRKALDSVSLNRSKLPTPGSKLKPPVTVKRSRSPEEAPANKRQRTSQENPINKPKPPATGNKLRPAKSTGSLNKVGLTNSTGPSGGRKLTGQTSGGNLRSTAIKNTTNRGPAAAKPPPKPERTSRKNWSKATETCLFISCDSAGHSEVEEDSVCVSQDGCLTDGGHSHFSRVHNVSLFSDDESVTGIRLDTDSGGDPDHDATPIPVTDRDATPISLTVVSCSRGVVNATCNCTICLTSGGADRAEFDDRVKHTGNDRVGHNGRQEGHEQLLQEFAKEANARSLLPKPAARLTAGKVAMTPAPVKRSRSKSGKPGTGKSDVKHGGEQKMVKNDATRISKLPVKEKTGDKIKMDVMPHKEFSKIGVCSTKSNATCNKELKSDNVAIRKSCHEFEDSEPECAQHEKICRKNDQCEVTVLSDGGVGTITSENDGKQTKIPEHKHYDEHENEYSSREVSYDKVIDCDVKSAGIVQKGSELQNLCTNKSKQSPSENSSVATFIHNPKPDTNQGEGSDYRHVDYKRDRSGSNERPSSRSQIPVRACRSPVRGQTSPSPNQSLASLSRESSQSLARTSIQGSGSPASKLPPRSPVYSRNSPSVTKRPPLSSRPNSPASPHCVSIKSPSQKSSNASRTSSLNKLTKLAQKQLKSLKSSNPVPENGLTDSKVHTTSIPKLVLNKQACPRVVTAEKRNLPRAPEKRTLRYGQRCMSDEELHDKGNAANKVTNGTAAPKPAPGGGGGKKRPAWDIKGRLQDMEEMMKTKDQQMMKLSEMMGDLKSNNKQLSGTAVEKEQQYTSVSKEKDILQSKLVESETELHTVKLKLERETEHFELTRNSLRRQKEELESQLNALQITESQLRSSLAQVTSSQEIIKAELAATKITESQLRSSLAQVTSSQEIIKAELAATKVSLEQSQQELVELRATKIEYEEKFVDYEEKFRNFETERRKLHNTIQELKGNIRVFCRVRPLLGDELLGNDGEIQHMNFPDDDNKTVELEKLGDVSLSETMINSTKRGANGRYSFSFDKVFLPESTQMTVFEEISQLVQSALDGYNVCIFAYGQTGSGKTYTMEGPSVEDEETMGMISRATIQIFQNTRDLEDKGWQYEFEASFLEIYNETIRDLLGNHGPDVKHDIKLGPGGKDVVVTNLTTQQVTRREQIVSILRTASKNRAVGETQCNERSSRSHSVFRLKITGANEITGETCAGTLNLIDLAGSERLKESGATGQRLKETQNINKSLANLGNVIMALGNKEPHVPYRNSKLTYLLQNSLGGNSKTLMFVNVSPREEHFSETVNSLRFATKVNQCNIGTATKKSK